MAVRYTYVSTSSASQGGSGSGSWSAAQIGLCVGIILGVLLLASVAGYFYNKREDKDKQEVVEEGLHPIRMEGSPGAPLGSVDVDEFLNGRNRVDDNDATIPNGVKSRSLDEDETGATERRSIDGPPPPYESNTQSQHLLQRS